MWTLFSIKVVMLYRKFNRELHFYGRFLLFLKIWHIDETGKRLEFEGHVLNLRSHPSMYIQDTPLQIIRLENDYNRFTFDSDNISRSDNIHCQFKFFK